MNSMTISWLNRGGMITILSVQLFNEMRRRKQKYGVVTMCMGTVHPPSLCFGGR